jgi:hypothetical protein
MSTESQPSSTRPADEDAEFGVPDEETPELTGNFFENAERGKYYFRMMQGSNVVRIAPELTEHFPNEQSVNDALRALLGLRQVMSRLPTETETKPTEPNREKRQSA